MFTIFNIKSKGLIYEMLLQLALKLNDFCKNFKIQCKMKNHFFFYYSDEAQERETFR